MTNTVLNLPDRTVEELKQLLGLAEVYKLSFNESPYGPSPAAVAAIRQAAEGAAFYHDPESRLLRTALAEHHGVTDDCFVIGNGADEIISLLTQTFLRSGDEAIIPVPTFGQYAAAVTLVGAKPARVPVQADMTISLAAIAAAVTASTKMIFLCNPNNPTGVMLNARELKEFVSRVPSRVLVVLDEAYAEYVVGEEYLSGVALLAGYSNVITVRTFSKVYGLAGLRIGYAIAQPEIAAQIGETRNPFNINSLGQAAALASVEDQAFAKRIAALNRQERAWLSQELTELGFKVYPSQTNFLFADTGRDCLQLCEALARNGIIIRPGTNWNLPTHVRISLGNHRINQLLVQVLREISR